MLCPEDDPFVVYVLSDPRDGAVRYVGMTTKGARRRLGAHLRSSALLKDTRKTVWIRSLLAEGKRPVVEVVEGFADPGPLPEAEQFWITQFRALGFDLTNSTDGGEGTPGIEHGWEVRHNMRLGQLGKRRSPEAIRKTSLANVGRSPWNKGKKGLYSHSPRTIRKIRKGRRGKRHRPETIEKMRRRALENIENKKLMMLRT